MKRFLFIAGVIGFFFVLGLLLVLPFLRDRAPSALILHLESIPWKTVTVESGNLPSPVLFNQGAAQCHITPISHGIYRIGIKLDQGGTLWSEFFHSNAGEDRRIDITVTPSATGFHFRQTANQSKMLFEGDTPAETSTEQKPFRLGWI